MFTREDLKNLIKEMTNALESTETEKTRWKRELARSKTNLETTQEDKLKLVVGRECTLR